MPPIKKTLHKIIDERSDEWLDKQIVWLGDYAQDVLTDVPGVLYARQINAKVIQVYNHTAMVPATFDLQVLIGRSKTLPSTWQIIAIRETYDTPAGGGQLAYHHTQHEYPSADTVWIDRKQIIPLTVLVYDSANFIVRVYGAVIHTASGVRQVSTQLVDLSSYVVTVGAKFITIESDDEGVLTVHEGTAFDAPEIGTYADIPVPAAGKYLIAYVLLYDGQAVLSDNDIRVPFPLPGAARSHTHAMDAADVTYTPGVLADWDYSNDPGDVEDGLDQLAERVTDIEAVGGSTEGIQDIVGAMFTGNTETGITATYQDADGTIDLEVTAAGGYPPGHLFGCALSNNGTDPTNDIDITAGNCRDSGNAVDMTIPARTKRLDAPWVTGTNQGGLSSSLTIANTTYHVFAIRVAGVDDVGFDTSVTAANLIADHSATHIRRLGSLQRISGAWQLFTQVNDEFKLKTPISDYTDSALGTSAADFTLASIPAGIVVNAIITATCWKTGTGSRVHLWPKTLTDQTATFNNSQVMDTVGGGATWTGVIETNTTPAIRAVAIAASTNLSILTRGWIDTRGRLS